MNAQQLLEEIRNGATVTSKWKRIALGGRPRREWLLKRRNGTIEKIQASTFKAIPRSECITCSVWSGERYVYEYKNKKALIEIDAQAKIE